jgi:outer membrane murein-binding lipoprotein Lpp
MNRKSIFIILITVLIGALLSGCVDNTTTDQSTPAGTSIPITTAASTAGTQEL